MEQIELGSSDDRHGHFVRVAWREKCVSGKDIACV